LRSWRGGAVFFFFPFFEMRFLRKTKKSGVKRKAKTARQKKHACFQLFILTSPPSLSSLKEKPPPAWSTARPCTRWLRRCRLPPLPLLARGLSSASRSSSSSSPLPIATTLIASLGSQPLQPAPPPHLEAEASERPLRTLASLSEAESPRRLLWASEDIFDLRLAWLARHSEERKKSELFLRLSLLHFPRFFPLPVAVIKASLPALSSKTRRKK